jgi:hypothetical protein
MERPAVRSFMGAIRHDKIMSWVNFLKHVLEIYRYGWFYMNLAMYS